MVSSLPPVSLGTSAGMTGVSTAHTSRRLAVASPNSITFWQQDEAQWSCISSLELPLPFFLFSLSHDGRKCAVVVHEPRGEVIHVYLVGSCILTATFVTVRGTTTALSWSPQGEVVSGNDEGWVYVWDFSKAFEPFGFQYAYKANLETLAEHPITAIAWSPNARSLATCEQDDVLVRLRDTRYDVLLALTYPSGKFLPVQAVAWSPGSQHLAVGRGSRVEIWARKARKTPLASFVNASGRTLTSLIWLSSGTQVLAANLHGDLCLWEVATGRLRQWEVGTGIALALSAGGLVVMGRQDGLVHLYDPVQQSPTGTGEQPARLSAVGNARER